MEMIAIRETVKLLSSGCDGLRIRRKKNNRLAARYHVTGSRLPPIPTRLVPSRPSTMFLRCRPLSLSLPLFFVLSCSRFPSRLLSCYLTCARTFRVRATIVLPVSRSLFSYLSTTICNKFCCFSKCFSSLQSWFLLLYFLKLLSDVLPS